LNIMERMDKHVCCDALRETRTYRGWDSLTIAVTATEYDALGRAASVEDRLGHAATYAYNGFGRLETETNAESGETSYTYDNQGRMLTLTDPEGNVTAWTYDRLGRVASETNELSDTREFVYSGGLLERRIDRLGRVIEYAYDLFGRQTGEYWYANETAADNDPTHQNPLYSIVHTYDRLGNVLTASDAAAEYEYVYDALGRVVEETQDIDGLTPVIVFSYQYSAVGLRTQTAATIGGVADAVTDYFHDPLGRVTLVEQHGVQGGNEVAEKRIDLSYDAASRYSTIAYYSDLDGGAGDLVMTAAYTYDPLGRLTDLVYTDGTPAAIREFGWAYDAAGRMLSHDSDIASEDVTSYTHDDTNQLTGADYTTGADESYEYDSNGNRVTANGGSYATDANNRLVSDGYFRYEYDSEGNLIYRYVDEDSSETLNAGDTEVTEYVWDHRNRLTEVVHKDIFGGATDWRAEYVYDCFNHRIASLYDIDGDTDVDLEERYVWQGKNVALDFVDSDGAGETESLELARRYLWGQAVDQLFAQEKFDDGGAEDVLYFVRDNLGSTRSLVDYLGQITATYSYDSFGNVTVQTGYITDTRYLYTCQEYDLTTGFYYYDARWYDPAVGKFISEDPIESDVNLYRYVHNVPTIYIDPMGLRKLISSNCEVRTSRSGWIVGECSANWKIEAAPGAWCPSDMTQTERMTFNIFTGISCNEDGSVSIGNLIVRYNKHGFDSWELGVPGGVSYWSRDWVDASSITTITNCESPDIGQIANMEITITWYTESGFAFYPGIGGFWFRLGSLSNGIKKVASTTVSYKINCCISQCDDEDDDHDVSENAPDCPFPGYGKDDDICQG